MKMTMKEATAFLYNIPKFTTKNGLDHTRAFMDRLGNPGADRKVIHVAGSNGKGSVCCFLYNMLRAGGVRVGLFTSPHLVDVRERFQIDGELVSETVFLQAFERVKALADQFVEEGLSHPTFFEFIFAMGMLIFEQEDVDYLILETGLGGRLDATNSIRKPKLCVITSLSLEHTEILGDTIEQIAAEKAGILKSGISVVFDENSPQAAKVIRERAQELDCPAFSVHPEDYEICKNSINFIDFSLVGAYDKTVKRQYWRVPFSAAYQVENASVAIRAMEVLKLLDPDLGSISREQMQEGMLAAKWPGRMQQVLPDVYFDGAHNTSGIGVFLQSAVALAAQDSERPLLLFSMVKEKDYHTSIAMLTEALDWEQIAVTTIPNDRGIPYEQLQQLFEEDAGHSIIGFADYREAFSEMRRLKKPGQKLFCTGSLYFVGALMEELQR